MEAFGCGGSNWWMCVYRRRPVCAAAEGAFVRRALVGACLLTPCAGFERVGRDFSRFAFCGFVWCLFPFDRLAHTCGVTAEAL